jgi:hypothetical protein
MLSLEQRVEKALHALDERWDAWPAVPERIVEVMSRTLGESAVAIHHWRDADIAFDAHNFESNPFELPWIATGGVQDAMFYDPTDPGRDADRVVSGEELEYRDAHRWARFEEGFLRPMELGDQVRALVTGDDGRLLAFLGTYARPGRRADPSQVRMFEHLLHPVAERLRMWKLLAETSSERAAVLSLVTEMRKPTFIVSASGALLFANAAARLAFDRTPAWLHRVCLPSGPPPGVRRIPVMEGKRRLYVCIAHEADMKLERLGQWAAKQWGLPARLRPPAAKIIAGRSDKEIARETSLSHATVRTYVQLIYRHVGVTSRTELTREALRMLYRE